MKKIISLICVLALVAGCEEKNTITSDGKLVEVISPNSICYEGMEYVKFGAGNSAWGSLKFNNSGKPVSCTVNTDIGAQEGCYQNVVYVRFAHDKLSWGSVKFNSQGNIVTCGRAVPQPLAPKLQ